MEKTLEGIFHVTSRITTNRLLQGLGWGFIGGLAGTLVMDLLLMVVLLALGLPAFLCFSIVGDTVSHFFALAGVPVAPGVPTGVVTHYVVGPLFGILFGGVVSRLPFLQGGSIKRTTLAAFVYVEVLSQPVLATTPILLKMQAPVILQWYVGSFVMHLVMSVVLGVVVGFGLRLAPRATPGKIQEITG